MDQASPQASPPSPRKGGWWKRMRLPWKILIIVVLVLVILWVASEIAIPKIASTYITNKVKNKYPQARDVSASVSAFPAIRLAFKDYSSLTVKVSDITIEGVTFKTIQLKSSKWPAGSYSAVVTPDETMRFFSTTHSFVLEPSLSLSGGKIQVSGKMNLGYAVAGITATGNLAPKAGKQVFFEPAEITVTGIKSTAQAQNVIRQIMASNPVFVIREGLPFTVTSIVATSGAIVVKGDVDLEKALKVKL
ncbi:MAG TPA: hypothetical protein VIK15_05515 [Candidatus Anoxymicrobiaceae bacterium]